MKKTMITIKGNNYSPKEAFAKFTEDFLEVIHELENSSSDSKLVNSYSVLCQSSSAEPSDDLWIFEADMHDRGWNEEALRLIFADFEKEIIHFLEDQSRGVGDYFLYKWSNKNFPLAGYTMITEPDDVIMKYYYGWQRNKYGLLFLNQNGYDKNKFVNLVADCYFEIEILPEIFDKLEFDLERGKKEKYEKKFKKFATVQSNTLDIKYKRIVEILNVMNFVEGGSMYEDIVSEREFLELLITNLKRYQGTSYELKPDSILCRFDA